eukprot:CAMPEP_0183437002 /NCGR_PEP_ID=MMETSP0370-20130417/71146_1 /TAXON_ID=268820 /ORGANISM="Peridinium aciculiferum, Strain PAER-2" /LENGTH=81 /DNA_ID=CAMNT_0025624641 /DNA_START=74 /DNA_END=315 /DNA_ORIENTATION=+
MILAMLPSLQQARGHAILILSLLLFLRCGPRSSWSLVVPRPRWSPIFEFGSTPRVFLGSPRGCGNRLLTGMMSMAMFIACT